MSKKNQPTEIISNSYYKIENNGKRVNITDRIKSGMTDLFSIELKDSFDRACKFAFNRRSYIFHIYATFDDKLAFAGYGVPK